MLTPAFRVFDCETIARFSSSLVAGKPSVWLMTSLWFSIAGRVQPVKFLLNLGGMWVASLISYHPFDPHGHEPICPRSYECFVLLGCEQLVPRGVV